MKAEHRKELETNVLADRMGRMVQKVRTGSRRRTVLYVVLAAAGLLVLLMVYRRIDVAQAERSALWFHLDDGAGAYIGSILRSQPDTNPGKAARFELAWHQTWLVIRKLGKGPKVPDRDPENPTKFVLSDTMEELDAADRTYSELAKDCAGDPFWEPEALYHLAVIEETRAIKDKGKLDSAQRKYEDVARDHKDSAYGKMAQKRLEQLRDDKTRRDIESLYASLGYRFRFAAGRNPLFDPDLFKNLKPPDK